MNDILSLFRYIPIVEQALQIANAPKIPCVVYDRKNVVCTRMYTGDQNVWDIC